MQHVASLPFVKYHGIGNDFLLIDLSTPLPAPLTSTQIRRLCDRHIGVGADGVLLLRPTPDAAAQMIIFNADGTRPEMCANGLRCAALHVAASLDATTASHCLRILTDVGILTCDVQLAPDARSANVRAHIGSATPAVTYDLPVDQHTVACHYVNVGNPHLILFAPPLSFTKHAPLLSTHSSFPTELNVSFVTPDPQPASFHAVVWERGVGPTLACGTAACAIASCCVDLGLAAPDDPIAIHLPGGTLQVTVSPDRVLHLQGPAAYVYSATVPLPAAD